MSFGAVITAAGMSTRMNQFKQLMNVGGPKNRTMAEQVVTNFLEAGITDIVVVTGFRADEVESALDKYKITFIKNPDYQRSQMFDSVKLGLSLLQNRCDKIFFCPVDIPFFKSETVKKLMQQEAELVYPSYNMKKGHPVLICSSLVQKILEYKGQGGLKGALNDCGCKPFFLELDDEAILYDADTRADFEKLIKDFGPASVKKEPEEGEKL